MSNPWFQFKQFRIDQQFSALKVGTDGVLLGAWCEISGARQILDVGTGTGVIALMLAQRSEAFVTAIEINGDACKDALLNFRNSPWNDRLCLHSEDFNVFQKSRHGQFDLVVSNPPFFKQSVRSADLASALARHDVSLSFQQIISGSKKLLNANGRLAVILPFDAWDDFRETARMEGFYLCRRTTVIPKAGKPPKRVLLEFSVEPAYPETGELVILRDKDNYTEAFAGLTKEFYLNFT